MDEKAIRKIGYLPFYEGIATNHRAVLMDLDTEYLFTNSNPDTNKLIFRGFTSDQTKKADKYLKKLEEEFKQSRVFKKANQLKEKR